MNAGMGISTEKKPCEPGEALYYLLNTSSILKTVSLTAASRGDKVCQLVYAYYVCYVVYEARGIVVPERETPLKNTLKF